MNLIIKTGKFCLGILYGILKLFPVKQNKVLFLSRQADTLSLDFSMLKDSLMDKEPHLRIVSICNRLDDSKKGLVGFGIDTLRKMCIRDRSKTPKPVKSWARATIPMVT